MNDQPFVSIESVFSKLIRSGRTVFSEDDVIEWCGEALELIGAVKAYEEAIAFIEIKNHQAKLPLGLHKIIQVARNNNHGGYRNCSPLSVCQSSYEQGCKATVGASTAPCAPCATPTSDAVWLDCNGTPIVSYDLAYYRPYFDVKADYSNFADSSYYRQNFTPVRLANHTLFGTLVSEECSGYNNNGADEYTVVLGNYIRTSFREGQICLPYYRQVRDVKTGYPMIPDEESYKTAINKYILMSIAGVDFENGREGAAQRLKKYEDDWQWYCSQSADKAMMPSGIDEYQNLLDQRLKLIPNFNSYYKFFGNLSKPEAGYPIVHNYGSTSKCFPHLPSCGSTKEDNTDCCCPSIDTNTNPTIIYAGNLPIVTVHGNELEVVTTATVDGDVFSYKWTNILYDGLKMEVFANAINRYLHFTEFNVLPGGVVEILIGGPYTYEDIFKMIPNGEI